METKKEKLSKLRRKVGVKTYEEILELARTLKAQAISPSERVKKLAAKFPKAGSTLNVAAMPPPTDG